MIIGSILILCGVLLFLYSFNKQRGESDLYNNWPFIGAIASALAIFVGVIVFIISAIH